MITLKINNNRGFINCSKSSEVKVIKNLRDFLKIRNPNAFYLRRYMPKGWDGYQHYITEKGGFQTGILPQICKYLEEKGMDYQVEDNRLSEEVSTEVRDKMRKWEYRPTQKDNLEAILNNKVGGVPFIRGIIKAATNAGKTLVIAGVYHTTKVKSIVIVNNLDLFNQMVKQDFPQLLPNKFGYMQGKTLVWGDVMICMAQTLSKRLKEDREVKSRIGSYGAVLVDEGDLSDNKTYKGILTALYGTYIRLCFSGSILVSTLAKYKIKNQNIKSFFGELLYEIGNKELIEKGYSSPIRIVINKGNTVHYGCDNFDEEYLKAIIKSPSRNKKIISRIKFHRSKGRKYFMVTVKNHKHVKLLTELLTKEFGGELKVDWVHHSKHNREQTINNFKAGNIDILVASLIVKRGLNLPLMQVMINASGGLSPENVLQLLGRATRKHESKKETWFEDFFDEGTYVKRHSRRRINVYENEGLPMIKLYKLIKP